MKPSLATASPYGVALVGEALGEDEAKEGRPFVGRAGFKLSRLIEWAGLDRGRFDIWNTVWCRPPQNKLEGEWYEGGAIAHCRATHWDHLLSRVRVVVPMGNTALGAFTGRKGILATRGYVRPGPANTHLLPTVHPSFIQRGQAKYSAPFIHDLQKAVDLATEGLPLFTQEYRLDPPPYVAFAWARDYVGRLERGEARYLAYDIETPGKGEDEGDLSDHDDPTYNIFRIGFSYAPHTALSIPWTPPYMATIRLLLESNGEKVVWNGGFDNPRIRANGVGINGVIHDGMVAWHILHSDLPKGLAFVATFTCPWQPEWKHLSAARPAFYNATDADVEVSSMLVIEEELRKAGLWEVYERDVIQLDPILHHMEDMGMPLDPSIRLEKAKELSVKQTDLLASIEKLVPLEARKVAHVYHHQPANVGGSLLSRPARIQVRVCPGCGEVAPTKPHFRVLKKKVNPCAGLAPVEREVDGEEWYRLAPFKPSRDQLIRYHHLLGRPIPQAYDKKKGEKKPVFDEKALRTLMGKYPNDPLYGLILDYREVDKLAGTYIGRLENAGEPGV